MITEDYISFEVSKLLKEKGFNINITFRRVLAFKTKELMDEFVRNFKDLIEIAKPLL